MSLYRLTQGDCTGFSTGLVRATIVSKDNSDLSEACNIPSWVCWNAKKILEKMSATKEMKGLKKKITDTHTCTHKQNDEIKTMVSKIKAFLTETEKTWAECRIKDSKCIDELSRSTHEQNDEIKTMLTERQKQVKERKIQVEEFRTLNAKLSNANEQNEAIKVVFSY